jgi:rare lipoprotein A (peptidoglycan hydrolase)
LQTCKNGFYADATSLSAASNIFLLAMTGTLLVPFTSKDVLAQSGIASVYSTRKGTQTASGVRLNDNALTYNRDRECGPLVFRCADPARVD